MVSEQRGPTVTEKRLARKSGPGVEILSLTGKIQTDLRIIKGEH